MRFHSIADVPRSVNEALGEHAAEFDVNAIIEQAYTFGHDTEPDADGVERMIVRSAGWEQSVGTDEWWEIAKRNNICEQIAAAAAELLSEPATPRGIASDGDLSPAERWQAAVAQRLGTWYDTEATWRIHEAGRPKLSFVAFGHVFSTLGDGTWTWSR